MNREEHLQWSKDRAIQELESGNKNDAFASFMSDMSNHPELENHKGLDLGMMLSLKEEQASKKKENAIMHNDQKRERDETL